MQPAAPIGLAALTKLAFDGGDLGPLWTELMAAFDRDACNAAAMMDLATIAGLMGQWQVAMTFQTQALAQTRLFRQPTQARSPRPTRLLAFLAPGDFMANAPLEFILASSDVVLDQLYVLPGQPLSAPAHDVAIVAIGESDANKPVLAMLDAALAEWPVPVLNRPARIAQLTRATAGVLLRDDTSVYAPPAARIGRRSLERVAAVPAALGEILPGVVFPIIARPAGTHAGDGLEKLEDRRAVAEFLRWYEEPEFHIAAFVDYRSPDGRYRKYRVTFIDGRAYPVHMGVSDHWMIHYLNAGMREDAGKRAEEARYMADFNSDFGRRHSRAFATIAARCGLDYVTMDCAEAPDGRLLLFEIDVPMIVHDMDPVDIFPYKRQHMHAIFKAFEEMVRRHGDAAEG